MKQVVARTAEKAEPEKQRETEDRRKRIGGRMERALSTLEEIGRAHD